jgi:hypothetical protein
MASNLGLRASALLGVTLVCLAATLVSGCSGSKTPAAPTSAPPRSVDELILSLDDVKHVAETDEFKPHTEWDVRRPPPADVTAPAPCRAVGHNDLTFGSNWSEFRSAGYHGITDDIEPGGNEMINGVTQAIGRYPNSDVAHATFHQLESSLQACVALHDPNYDFAMDKPDPSTIRLSAEQWCHLYRAKSAVMVSIGVEGLQSADLIANTLLKLLTDRIE